MIFSVTDTNLPLSSSLLSFSLVSASGEVLLLWEVSSVSPLNSPLRGTSVTMATTTEPSLGHPYTSSKTAPRGRNSSAALTENWPLHFVFLWRMVALTSAHPDVRLWWRLLRSSLNHAPVRKRRRVGSVSVCSRILERWHRAKFNNYHNLLAARVILYQPTSQTKQSLLSLLLCNQLIKEKRHAFDLPGFHVH